MNSPCEDGFTVKKLETPYVYRDIGRVPEAYRKDDEGDPIDEGVICRVTCVQKNSKPVRLVLRGHEDTSEREIFLDETTRKRLGVTAGEKYQFKIQRGSTFDIFMWGWHTSDVGYRIAYRLGAFGLLLGFLGLLPTIFEVAHIVGHFFVTHH
jgi:hypothetical protein